MTAYPYQLKLDDRLNDKEMEELRKARATDAERNLTQAQAAIAAQLQRALRQLPLTVIENHVSVALQERNDFDYEAAQRFACMFNDRVWDFL